MDETKPDPAPPTSTVIKVRDMSVDMAGAFPLRIGDWRKLEAKGITSNDLYEIGERDMRMPITAMATFVQYCCGKVNPQITEEYIDGMTPTELNECFVALVQVRARSQSIPT